MKKPKFILISDCHYSLSNLELSDKAFRAAIEHACKLGVPLIDCGDLTNDKAILRGEVLNRLLSTFTRAEELGVRIYCLVGNHSLINEKAPEHVLNFLKRFNNVTVIDQPMQLWGLPQTYFIPYQTNPDNFIDAVSKLDSSYTLITHQGFKGADMGDYIQDKSAIDVSVVSDNKVFSGHYHKHQNVGTVTYVGNPFSMSYGEAFDGPKGYLIVYDDNTYKQVVLHYRKHVIWDWSPTGEHDAKPGDLLWVKVSGPQLAVDRVKKEDIKFNGDFKFERVVNVETPKLTNGTHTTPVSVFDKIIDAYCSELNAKRLKQKWRDLIDGEI